MFYDIWPWCLALLLFGVVAVSTMVPRREKVKLDPRPFRPFSVPRQAPLHSYAFERRLEPRLACDQVIECRDLTRRIQWGRSFHAKITNRTDAGCQILSNVELPMTTLLFLKDQDCSQLAFVAYCNDLGEGYQVGLEFLPQRSGFT